MRGDELARDYRDDTCEIAPVLSWHSVWNKGCGLTDGNCTGAVLELIYSQEFPGGDSVGVGIFFEASTFLADVD